MITQIFRTVNPVKKVAGMSRAYIERLKTKLLNGTDN